ncbi:MAG: tryptophanase, partial [Bacteroidales bacterium]|nr:tryptophanase [Bacteroidales bacterium]
MISEPHKIKTIRKVNMTTFRERVNALQEAHYNTFRIPSDKVTFDMTSYGTSAVSQDQLSGLFIGDETYAGSRNFEHLEDIVYKTFGHKHICPTHNIKGSIKLITSTMVSEGDIIYSNSLKPEELTKDKGAIIQTLLVENDPDYPGNINTELLKQKLSGKTNIPYVYIELYSDGFKPISISNIKEVYKIAEQNNTVLVLNISYIISNALYIREKDTAYENFKLADIVKEITANAHILILDAAQDPRSNAGGLIATNINELYDKYMNEVVVFEGLHTYGGMAGRTMEVFARGIKEMVYEEQAMWIEEQIKRFASNLKDIPYYLGADGVYIKANEFLSGLEDNHAQTLSAALYLKSGVRAFLEGRYSDENILPVQIPRLSITDFQLEQIAEVINELFVERDKIVALKLTNDPSWQDEAIYKWKRPILKEYIFDCEPFAIQNIEYVGVTSKEERQKFMVDAGYNTFLLKSKHVYIDFLTDSGTTSQSTEQWSKYLSSSETQASSINYFELVDVLKDITGYKYIIPAHQGRAGEHIMSQCLIKDGYVPGNMYFTTTKLHQELAGGTFADIIVDEAHVPASDFKWKGNIDLKKLDAIVKEHGAESIPYISFEFSVNMAGGQPASMDNIKEVYEYCEKRNIYVMFDATRAVENAYMIKKRDPQYKNIDIKDIVKEMFSYGHGCTVSSKKDYMVNIGGFLGIKDDEKFYKDAMEMLRIYEGSPTNGGLAAGDLAVHAEGVKEMVDFNYIKARVEQTQYLGEKLLKAGIPIIEPVGSHAVFLDAKRFLPHIDQDNYPSQALASALYVESGVRAMERGNVSKGRGPDGKNYRPALELVRLTIPRRAYTNSHMDLVAEKIIDLYKKRDTIKGLKFIYEPDKLRFFQGRFEEI